MNWRQSFKSWSIELACNLQSYFGSWSEKIGFCIKYRETAISWLRACRLCPRSGVSGGVGVIPLATCVWNVSGAEPIVVVFLNIWQSFKWKLLSKLRAMNNSVSWDFLFCFGFVFVFCFVKMYSTCLMLHTSFYYSRFEVVLHFDNGYFYLMLNND